MPEARTRRVVVIDDDPTGGQTVAEVPVITAWDADDLAWLLSREREMGFVLTNSRALSADRAAAISGDIVGRCLDIADHTAVDVSFVSRSDSTLRGHFAAELSAICRTLTDRGRKVDLILVVPAFFEAGRITRDDVHYVVQDGAEVAVANTAYARDPAFGFAESNLIDWVRARLDSPDAPVTSLPLSLIRDKGVSGVVTAMRAVRDRRAGTFPPVLVANGTDAVDYETVAEAARLLEAEGMTIVTRSGPSYLASRLGEPLPDPVADIRASAGTGSYGLVVVGSHVPLSTAQLTCLIEEMQPQVIELDASAVTGEKRADHLSVITAAVSTAIKRGHVVLATSRELLTATDANSSLDVAEAVSSAVDEVVSQTIASTPPAWIVAKGGITSANMVTRVLKLRRGWIVGQVFRGLLPLWRDDDPNSSKPLCVIFPGNVGTPRTLLDVVRQLDHSLDPAPT